MMSNLLKEQYSAETGIEYDLVIRNRIDYSPHVVLKLNEIPIDDDTLIYQDLYQPDGMISDWFGMGSTNYECFLWRIQSNRPTHPTIKRS